MYIQYRETARPSSFFSGDLFPRTENEIIPSDEASSNRKRFDRRYYSTVIGSELRKPSFYTAPSFNGLTGFSLSLVLVMKFHVVQLLSYSVKMVREKVFDVGRRVCVLIGTCDEKLTARLILYCPPIFCKVVVFCRE